MKQATQLCEALAGRFSQLSKRRKDFQRIAKVLGIGAEEGLGEASMAVYFLERGLDELHALRERGIELSPDVRTRLHGICRQLKRRGRPNKAHYGEAFGGLVYAYFLKARQPGVSVADARHAVARRLGFPDDADGKTDETVAQIIKRTKRRIRK